MNAVSLYVTTCRYVFQSDPADQETWADLYRYLPYLRQALSCCVCTRVLDTPMGPADTICQHHVCKNCIGGKMRLKPGCSWCKDYDDFVEKPQLRIIIQCFKRLCHYLASTPIAQELSSPTNGGTNALMAIIQEGMAITDSYNHSQVSVHSRFNAFPQSLLRLPCPTSVNLAPAGPCGRGRVVSISEPNVNGNMADDESQNDLKETSSTTHIHHGHDHPKSEQNGDKSLPIPAEEHTTVSVVLTRSPRSPRRAQHAQLHLQSQSQHSQSQSQSHQDGSSNNCGNSHGSDSRISQTVAAEHDYDGHAIYSVSMTSEDAPRLKIRRTPIPITDPSSMSSSEAPSGQVSPPVRKRVRLSSIEGPTGIESPDLDAGSPSGSECSRKPKKGSQKKSKPKGCRCGLATPTPGKLTCCGQRCPCYSAFKGCTSDCRCRGCRNSRKERPVTPPQLEGEQDSGSEDSEIDIDI